MLRITLTTAARKRHALESSMGNVTRLYIRDFTTFIHVSIPFIHVRFQRMRAIRLQWARPQTDINVLRNHAKYRWAKIRRYSGRLSMIIVLLFDKLSTKNILQFKILWLCNAL